MKRIALLLVVLGACAGDEGGAGSAATAGAAGSGGVGGIGGTAGSGGTGGTAGSAAVGGDGGTAGSGGSAGTAGSGGVGGTSGTGGTAGDSCDPGSTSTAWATDCPTAPPSTCVTGTWTDPGSTTNDPLVCESAHFAVHAPNNTITLQQCNDATNTLETIVWPTLFGSPIFMPEPYCDRTQKYKASIVVHNDWGLTGGGWGNGYMGMWIGPSATADHWGLAHEFTHAVQSQNHGLECGGPPENNFCGWFYESHANWVAHQLPEYHDDNVHCSELLVNAPHLYLGSTRDRYCNWQFLEFLKDKHCYSAVNAIWTTDDVSNDVFSNIASTRGWSLDQLNDFFGEWALHNVTWDYRDPPPTITAGNDQGALYRSNQGYGAIDDVSRSERRLRTARLDVLDASQRRYAVHPLQAPQRWGYNIVRLHADPGAAEVTVTFRGVTQTDASSDWRWAMVATNSDLTSARYSTLQRGADAELRFCVQPGELLWLVVTATPSVQQKILWDQLYPTIYRYPYMVQLTGAQPEGFQANAPTPTSNGAVWPNGGGWVAANANVDDGAFIGPQAMVLSGSVGAQAHVDGHAVIAGATVDSGTVTGLSILGSGTTIRGNAEINLAWPFGPGHFERPQIIEGDARLIGDLELRGPNTNKDDGTYCGFADNGTNDNCSTPDLTSSAPFIWRP